MMRQRLSLSAMAAVVMLGPGGAVYAQQAPQPPQPPRTGKAAAPIDLTGYWVSVVTEDWRWRMVTPARGDYASVPLNLAAKTAADAWDPAKDEAVGEQCRSYGAPAVMRTPERIHITWQDDQSLKVETDAGQQTRLFHFGDWKPSANAPATWQGESVATWEMAGSANGRGAAGGRAAAGGRGVGGGQGGPRSGNLKVITTHLRPGYLRKNGIPYSAQTVLTENWDLLTAKYQTGSHQNEQWLVITTVVHDPAYLQDDWITALNFKKEPDASKWDPQPCSARW